MIYYQKITRTLLVLLVISFSLFITSCGLLGSDDNDDTVELVDGLSPEIWDLVDEELISVLEDSLDMPIHRGDDPPNILQALSGSAQKVINAEGVTVAMRPLMMVKTLVPNDRCADDRCNWFDLYILFNEQDFENNEVTIRMRHAEESEYTGIDGFISGNGNNFSIFVEQVQDFDGKIVKMVSLFSGSATSEGIKDPHWGIVMIDNAGLEDRIPNGTGRSFKDGKDLAEVDEWPVEDENAKIINGEEGLMIWSI